jgi:hypothetical protein
MKVPFFLFCLDLFRKLLFSSLHIIKIHVRVAKPAEDGYQVWGVNAKDEIYYRAGNAGSWEQIAGGLKNVAISSGDGNHVWVVNTHDKVYYRAGRSAGNGQLLMVL